MKQEFTTAERLALDLQRILRQSDQAMVELHRDHVRLQLLFECGGNEWTVELIRAKVISRYDFRNLFARQDDVIAILNERGCLASMGLKVCACGNDNLHIVADVLEP